MNIYDTPCTAEEAKSKYVAEVIFPGTAKSYYYRTSTNDPSVAKAVVIVNGVAKIVRIRRFHADSSPVLRHKSLWSVYRATHSINLERVQQLYDEYCANRSPVTNNEPTTQEETTMKCEIQNVTFINGKDAKTYSPDDMIKLLDDVDKEVATLRNIVDKPNVLQERMKQLQTFRMSAVAIFNNP